MPNRFHSTLLLVIVFVLGISAGVGSMIFAWPAVRGRFFPRHRQNVADVLHKSLGLTDAQTTQIQGVFKDLGDQRHAIHQQFVPEYAQICSEYTQARQKERAEFDPVTQASQAQLRSILSDTQWQKFQQQRTQAQRSQPPGMRQPDLCRAIGYGQGGRGPRSPSPPPHR